jgi:hypothetical protein
LRRDFFATRTIGCADEKCAQFSEEALQVPTAQRMVRGGVRLVVLMASRLEEPGEVVQLEAVVGADVFPCGEGELKRGESSDDVTSEDVVTDLIWGRADEG